MKAGRLLVPFFFPWFFSAMEGAVVCCPFMYVGRCLEKRICQCTRTLPAAHGPPPTPLLPRSKWLVDSGLRTTCMLHWGRDWCLEIKYSWCKGA